MNNNTQTTKNPKKKTYAIILALIGAFTSLPLAGLHKFYLNQPLWGMIYLIIGWQNPMARIACAMDIILYLAQNQDKFNQYYHKQNPQLAQQMTEIATAIRELEKLRTEGLISEYEFEQKRRQLLS
jgi:TM2 domain-containing membrane protein YozV